ncbi:hypothetical protein [Acinetobacter bereziniae]|uniref:hypothetical protein n=1 Tax=Acinetobacter bereziniae TaxID=106648 RepID=UPI0034CDF539
MSTNIKLNKWEQEALSEKLILLNKKLVLKGHKPLSAESQIVHKILEITVGKLNIDDEGNLKIEL